MVGLTHCKNISMLLMMDKLNLELVTCSQVRLLSLWLCQPLPGVVPWLEVALGEIAGGLGLAPSYCLCHNSLQLPLHWAPGWFCMKAWWMPTCASPVKSKQIPRDFPKLCKGFGCPTAEGTSLNNAYQISSCAYSKNPNINCPLSGLSWLRENV